MALCRAFIAFDLLWQVLAVIGLVRELIRWSPIILQLVRIDALELIVLQVLLRAVRGLEPEHIEGVFVHSHLQGFQILRGLLRDKKRHLNDVSEDKTYLAGLSSAHDWGRREGDSDASLRS